MKQYIKSFRIFAVPQVITSVLGGGVGACVGIAIVFLLNLLSASGADDDFRNGFLAGFMPSVGIVVPVISMVLMNGIFSAINSIAQGYKYFHSMPQGAEHFRRAVICGNLLSLILCLLWALVMIPLGTFVGNPLIVLMDLYFGFLGLGIINLTGFNIKGWIRIVGMVPIFLLAGFSAGFTAAMTEDGETISPVIIISILVFSLAVFAVGFVFSLVNAKKKWYTADKIKAADKAKEAAA